MRSSPLALTVLSLLHMRPLHPYGIQRLIKQWGKDQVVNVGQRASLYRTIDRLLGADLIAVRETRRDQQYPERTVYEVTDAGRLELIDWLSELLCRPVKEFTRFEAGLSLIAVLPPKDVTGLLEERCRRLQVEIEQYRALRKLMVTQQIPRLFLIESEYRMTLREAELSWTRGLIADIASGTLEGMERWTAFHEKLG
jgi:DNA-binding PadR family transcriptional regulator